MHPSYSDAELPVAGDFNAAGLASARRIDPAQWNSDAPLLGLVREAGYVWGTVRDADGNLFSVMRRIPPSGVITSESAGERRGLGGRLIVLSTLGPVGESYDSMRIRREAKDATSSENVRRQPLPDGVCFSATAGEGRPMRLALAPDSCTYQEEGVLDLAGSRACPALQWYLPGPASALLYLTQTWEVQGSVLGRPVRGFLFWEEAYMYPGARLYVERDPLHDAGYTSWYSWATRWDDETTEVGHFLTGGRAFGIGVTAASTGEVSVARQVSAAVHVAPTRDRHTGIDFDLDGVAWHCAPDPRGLMELGAMPNPQQEGLIQRRGETRTPELHMAWGESVPARLVS